MFNILKNNDLNSNITEDSLSVGEKQLICIARAIVRKSKIILLDEATASVDMITEEKIQIAIKSYLKDSTLIAIAHRIKTISNYDRIIVLDKGKVVEFDSPNKLLKNKNGFFYKLHEKASH